jgi:3-oxoacyl-[acyl-carrier-protein] synthase I
VEEKMESALKSQDVWVADDSILSPLGSTSEENFANLVNSVSGIEQISDPLLSAEQIFAGKISGIKRSEGLTRFEQMCVEVVTKITSRHKLPSDKTLFILSTTKGNIDLLKSDVTNSRIHLPATAKHIANAVGLKNVLVVSNACISGVMAITIAKRYLQSGKYQHAIILGADELTSFVVSGFQSLGALSNTTCKPFDRERSGINLGEAAAAILITTRPQDFEAVPTIKILGSGLTNDANHISGPSRTGEELAIAIAQSLIESEVSSTDIDFISAHGTATLYNDEMESKAFARAGFSTTPVNSLKGFYGHTLGAAGVLETIIGVHSLKQQTLVPSLGFSELGVSENLNLIMNVTKRPLKTFLKTASGFGGCNAAIILQKQT